MSTPEDYFARLRNKAEAQLKELPVPDELQQLSADELKRRLHQLSVYQMELEMQGSELLDTQQKLLESLNTLKQQKNLYRSLYDDAPVGYLLLDQKGLIRNANAFFYRKTSLIPEMTLGRPFFRFLHEADQPAFVVRFPAFFKQPDGKIINAHIGRPGKPIPVAITGSHVQHSDYGSNLLRLVLLDMSDYEALQNELRLTSKVFEFSMHGILIADACNMIVKVNPTLTQLLGYSTQELVGHTPTLFDSGEQDELYYQKMWLALKNQGSWHGEFRNRKKSGELCEMEVNIFTLRNNLDEVTHYIATYQDITEKKNAARLIEHLAEYDQLTDLPNRRLLNDRLSQAIKFAQRQQQKIAVLFLDLDHFKSLNDTYGHLIGDELLRQIAQRLKACLRDSDTLARFGGDEFVIVLGELAADDSARLFVEQISQKLLKELSKPFYLLNTVYQTTFSIGIALYPEDGDCETTLLQNADAAMYFAKTHGRNCLSFFSNQLQGNLKQLLELQQHLRQALDRQEFRLYYQLQTDLQSGEIIGMETLIRWLHPSKGLLLPDSFLTLAEEHGYMREIDDWVIDQTCRQLHEWQTQGFAVVPISINVTYHQFGANSNLVTYLTHKLDQYQLAAGLIKIEVTESGVMRDIESACKILNKLVEMNIEIALDDFGTGYSSLTYLRRLPINLLKIDKSFVRDVLNNQDDQIIVRSTIAMTQAMGIKILAEGVETTEQACYLEQAGCHFGQGNLYSRPLSARAISEVFDCMQQDSRNVL